MLSEIERELKMVMLANTPRGVGIQSGVWTFEEFNFVPTILGSATVLYRCDWRKLESSEVMEGDMGKHYDLVLSEPRVTGIVIDGDRLGVRPERSLEKEITELVLDAWKASEHWVLEFEMGLL